MRRSEVLLETDRKPSGSIFSFLPADGVSRAGAVAQRVSRTLTEGPGKKGKDLAVLLADFDRRAYSVWSAREAPQRLDGKTWGAFVSHVDGVQVLNAREVMARQLGPLLNYARRNYQVVCADLTAAKEDHAREVLAASAAIFVVSTASRASLESACEKISWLDRAGLADRCGLLLEHCPHRVSTQDAEDVTGLPLCSLVDTDEQIAHFATWLMASTVAAGPDRAQKDGAQQDTALALAG